MIPFPNVTPEIFSIQVFGYTLALRWYALSYIAGFIFALWLMKFFIVRKGLWRLDSPPLRPDQADSLLTYLVLGVIVGGRMGYVLFYNFDYYSVNYMEIFQIWDGGMAFHGGFLGVVVAVIIYCAANSISLWSTADLIAMSSPPGLFLGRLANFINAELWGKPTEVPWGVIFPGVRAQDCFGIVGVCARHPSQLYEAFLEGLLLFVALFLLAKRGYFKWPGFITGFFAVGYGLSRFLVEYFRVPDPQFFSKTNPYGFAFKYGEFGITMGQTLSLPMILIGLVLMFYAFKAKETY